MKIIVASSLIAVAIIFGAIFYVNKGAVPQDTGPVENVTVVDGKQIIDVRARGGYTPRKSVAKAGIPTILRFTTAATFDCSASVRIPSLNVSQILAQSGTTDIDLGIPKVGVLQGSCGMGMYPFEIDFQA